MISKEMYIFKNYKTMKIPTIWKMWIELNCRKIPTIWKVNVLCGLDQIIGTFLQFERYGLNQGVGK